MKRHLYTTACSLAALSLFATACTQKRHDVAMVDRTVQKNVTSDEAKSVPVDQEADLASVTIVPGRAAPVQERRLGMPPKPGDISLNFPNADISDVAKAVLTDILGETFTIAPGLVTRINLVTATPVRRDSVLALFEDALKAAGMALIRSGSNYNILSLEQARSQMTMADGKGPGFASETITLKFVNADEMRKLLEPVLPGVITRSENSQNTLVISGTSGQRTNARELLRQFDVNWLRSMSFALYVPKRTDSRLIVPELDKLLNSDGAPTKGLVRLIAMEKLNGVLAISLQRQYLEDVSRWVEILDRETSSTEARLYVYRVQNGRSSDLAKVIRTAFGSGGVSDDPASSARDVQNMSTTSGSRNTSSERQTEKLDNSAQETNQSANNPAPSSQADDRQLRAKITSDDTNNAVLIYGTPRDYAVIEQALRQLDILPYQVMIEAAIAEVTLNDKLRYGLQWSFSEGRTNSTLSDGATSAITRNFPGFSFLYSNQSNISATLNALENMTRVNVISAPKLLVLNNQTASLQVGDQVPVATGSSVSTQTPDAPIVNSIEYRDTGVILKITPRVNSSGLVLLDVAQEVSDVSQNTTSSINSPTISTRRIASSVAVQDGQVIALGGLIRSTVVRDNNGVPYLSRVPIFGSLFGRQGNDKRRTELVILLRPRVIRTLDDGNAITKELRDKLRMTDPLPDYGTLP